MSACGFTGYRYEKLPFGRRDACAIELLKSRLREAVLRAYKAGCTHFISGFAQGSDLLFAETVTELRDELKDITLEAALPFENPQLGWCLQDRRQYEALLPCCDSVHVHSQAHWKGCYFARNDYIVRSSERLIAVYNGRSGGTAYTLARAQREGIPVEIVRP